MAPKQIYGIWGSSVFGDQMWKFFRDSATTVIDQPRIISTLSTFTISPQPAGRYATISFNQLKAGQVTIKAFTLSGKRIATLMHNQLTSGHHTTDINLDKLDNGIYLIKLINDRIAGTSKLSVIK